MNPYRVIGIDPALTNLGLVVLESLGPLDYRVLVKETVKTSDKSPMLTRLSKLQLATSQFLIDNGGAAYPIIVEDPSTQRAVERQRPRNICVMGMAVGAILGSTLQWGANQVYLIDPDTWMPKMETGRFSHIMPKQMMIRTLLGQVKFPPGETTEHEIMAAGVARYWIEQERYKAKRGTL